MRLQHVLEAVYHRPWLISPAGHASIVALIETKLERAMHGKVAAGSGRGRDFFTDEPIPGMSINGGVAVIPVHGVIGQRLGVIEKSCGAVDVGDLADELDQAESDPSVRATVFDFDTPGGMVSGTPELADKIRAAKKPTYAFSDSQVGSAGYWLAASVKGIFSTRGAEWGSIGVYIPWRDTSGLYSNAGIKVKVFSSGTYKGMGHPGTSLTAEQEVYLQSTVNELADEFYTHVRSNRGKISDEDMQGQMFSAKKALSRGFIDGIVSSLSDVIRSA